MAKVNYLPTDDMPRRTTQFGFDFDRDNATDVPAGHAALKKFRGNPFFSVEDDPLTGQGGAQSGLRAIHRGRGVYGIVDGIVPLDQLGQMTKADADAFNALSESEKSAFVDKPPVDPPQPTVGEQQQ